LKFVYEFINEHGDGYNFIDCQDVNPCGRPRFGPSSFVSRISNYKKFLKKLTNLSIEHLDVSLTKNKFNRYIIPSGVSNHPNDWCGDDGAGNGINPRNPTMKNLFDCVSQEYYSDLQTGKAFLLLDQTLEGYQTSWLWDWFHNSLTARNISPSQIIYVTGNLTADAHYNNWCRDNNIADKMLVLGHSLFEELIFNSCHKFSIFGYKSCLPSLKDQLSYKKKNLNSIKVYNALQKRPRPHRMWLFTRLFENNLLDDGINSMNDFDIRKSWYEGKTISPESYYSFKSFLPIFPYPDKTENEITQFSNVDSGKYQFMFNEDIVFDTWVSVISEASFGDSEETCFISEKSFKPILIRHPFIIFGNKHSLQKLKDMGYKTFHPMINESYDNHSTWERLELIVNEINRIKSMSPTERLHWFESMTDILNHNYDIARRNSNDFAPQAVVTLNQYFGNTNV
jgi:hypothetical protein